MIIRLEFLVLSQLVFDLLQLIRLADDALKLKSLVSD